MTTPQRGYPTATAAVQAQLASTFYGAQALLATMATRDILAIWQQLSLRDIRSSWPALRTALSSLIENRFGMSAAQAATYYTQARTAAGATGQAPVFNLPPVPGLPGGLAMPEPAPVSFPGPGYTLPPIPFPGAPAPEPVTPAPEPPVVSIPAPSQELVTATLDSTGPYGLLGRLKQAQPLEQAAETTGVVLSGAASRLIQNGARQAIVAAVQADPQAIAWMRVTAANPCAFCAMLASRIDYKSAQSAGFKAHNHCRCTAAPVFSQKDAAALADNDLLKQWRQVTKGLSGADARRAWRRYWDAKMGRDGIRVLPAA